MPLPITKKGAAPVGGPQAGLQNNQVPWSNDHLNFSYITAGAGSVFSVDQGVLAVPVSQLLPGPNAVEIVAIHAPFAVRQFMANQSRDNQNPVPPDLTPNSNEVLLSYTIAPHAPHRIADGTVIYSVIVGANYLISDSTLLDKQGYSCSRLPVEADPTIVSLTTFDSNQKG